MNSLLDFLIENWCPGGLIQLLLIVGLGSSPFIAFRWLHQSKEKPKWLPRWLKDKSGLVFIVFLFIVMYGAIFIQVWFSECYSS